MEIKFIGFYDLPESKCKRVAALAATNKMDYICEVLNRAGYSVQLISPSWIDHLTESKLFDHGRSIILSSGKRLTLCPSFKTKLKVALYLKVVFSLTWLYFWLVLNVHRGEKIIAYHSPWLSLPLRWAKWLKGFKLILEVEEIYADVHSIHPYFNTLESTVIKSADGFIFSTEFLRERTNVDKPSIILYGIYKSFEIINIPKNDGKIHLLYSGIIDFHKAGAFNAIESARFLPDNYVLHILGFGEIDALKKRIDEINQTTRCKVIYEGIMTGSEFISFGQGCHIGLSTQSKSGEYLNSSFPSKILTYLALGLRVISCRIDCVSKSLINELVVYYNSDSPESIANAIMSVNFQEEYNSFNLISEIDNNFLNGIKELLTD